MSPSWRDELRVALTPASVGWVQLARGLGTRVRAAGSEPCGVDRSDPRAGETGVGGIGMDRVNSGNGIGGGASPPWHGALEALEAACGRDGFATGRVTAVVSNHFVRYLLIPWSDALDDDAQEQAYAHHHFRRVFGDAADLWELRVDPATDADARLVSAIDARLLQRLRDWAARSGASLASIQPYLMTRFNACRSDLRGADGWLALGEPGLLCLALLRRGRWARLRTMRVEADWLAGLPQLIERETYLAEQAADCDTVFVAAPALDATRLARDGRWRMVALAAPQAASAVREQACCAMAIGG